MKKKLLSIFLAAVLTCSLFSAACVTAAAEETAVSVQTNTYFTIKNLGSGKMLNVRGNSSKSNTNVTVYEEDYTTGQNFQFLSNGSGAYVLEAQCAPACALNVYGSSSSAGANVNIWTKTGHSTQAWVVEYSAASGGYIIRSANNTNFVLAASGSANASNVCLQQYDSANQYQVWSSNAFSTTGGTPSAPDDNTVYLRQGSYFTIKNLGSDKMLNVRGNSSKSGTNVTVFQADGTTGQKFMFLANGSGRYVLQPQCAGACALNVYGSSSAPGENVNIWTKTGHSTQAWVIEYNSSLGGCVIRSADNTNCVLAASGSANSNNVSIQQYDPENRYQVWTSDAFSIGKAPDPSAGKTAAEITDQISSTYSTAKSMNGGAKFYGWCGVYIVYQLRALNLSSSSDTDITGNGNQMYSCIKAGTTSTGYTKTKYAGNSCLNDIVNAYSGQNVYNIVVSWTHQYGYTDKNPGAGHVTFIHAIIDGTVYYSESYTSGGKGEGTPLSCSLENFYKSYNASYGNAIGAVHFTK